MYPLSYVQPPHHDIVLPTAVHTTATKRQGFSWSFVAFNAFSLFVFPAVVIASILSFMKKRGKIGYRHRRMLNRYVSVHLTPT